MSPSFRLGIFYSVLMCYLFVISFLLPLFIYFFIYFFCCGLGYFWNANVVTEIFRPRLIFWMLHVAVTCSLNAPTNIQYFTIQVAQTCSTRCAVNMLRWVAVQMLRGRACAWQRHNSQQCCNDYVFVPFGPRFRCQYLTFSMQARDSGLLYVKAVE